MYRLLVCTLAIICSTVTSANEPLGEYIQVSGNASMMAQPDILTFSINLEERGLFATKLNTLVTLKTERIVTLLMEQGVASNDIQSMQLALYPWFERKSESQKGFVVNRTISVVIRDFEIYPRLIDNIMKIGVNRIERFSYQIEDTDAIYQTTLLQALSAAQKRAAKIANRLDVKLGKILTVEELSNNSATPQFAVSRTMNQQSSGFLPGQISTTAKVLVRYKVLD